MSRIALLVLAVLFLAGTAVAKDPPKKAPSDAKPGVVGEWQTAEGLVYRYRLPKSWDEEKGANLVLILHGSNLDRRWGFANHVAKTFRPDDIVVSPDGTTSNGRGGFNSMSGPNDLKRFKTLLDELKGMLQVKQTYLYGHSQGSFFSQFYASEHPEDVDGIVAHASGIWIPFRGGKKGHHQAIVVMHGTQDPVVSYGQSVGAYDLLEERKYPMVRFFSLEGWNHWPAEHNGQVPHTSQELSWCVGMTAKDIEDVEAAFDFLADVDNKEVHDYAALYGVAARVAEMDDAPAALKGRAEKAKKVVEDLVAAHVAALPEKPIMAFEEEDWVGHLPVFLRAYQGVPAAEAYRETWQKAFDKMEKTAFKHLGKYYKEMRAGEKREAFIEGVAALETGFLHASCWDHQYLANLETWRKEAKALKLPKKTLKTYDQLIKGFTKARKGGRRAYAKVQNKAGKV